MIAEVRTAIFSVSSFAHDLHGDAVSCEAERPVIWESVRHLSL